MNLQQPDPQPGGDGQGLCQARERHLGKGGSGAFKSLFALAENYPDLKANENFLSLQNDLAEVEEKIQAARRYYNGSVRDKTPRSLSFQATWWRAGSSS